MFVMVSWLSEREIERVGGQSDGDGCFLGLGKRRNILLTGRPHCSMHMTGEGARRPK